MNGKQKSLLVVMTLAAMVMMGFAGDQQRQATSTRTSEDIQRTEVEGNGGLGSGEQAPVQQAPEYAALRQQYMSQIEALQAQLATMQNEAEEASVQEQIMSLKQSYKVARLNLALEQARAANNIEAETRILAALNNLTDHPAQQRRGTIRDPQTGEAVEGGAR